MRQRYEQVVILSAELNTNSFEKNRQLTSNLEACLYDCNLSFKKATGSYKGQSEACFVVVMKQDSDLDILKDFAFKSFCQESILFQDSEGQCSLLFKEGSQESVGKLKQIPNKLIDTVQNYVILNGVAYSTEQTNYKLKGA